MKLLVYISLLSVCQFSFGKTISGNVFDKSDNAPITGAIIKIEELSLISTSNASGQFSFQNLQPGNYNLQISSVGFKKSLITISLSKNDTTLSIEMIPSVEDLDAVVITGTRTEKRLKEAPVLTQLIRTDRMHDIGITDVNTALEHEVPGLNLSQFSYRSKVSFQGMNAKYVLFLVDGERISGEMDGDIDYSRLNLDNVDRIEVVQGASSALYGSNAIGGVVNIITKKQEAKFSANSNLRYMHPGDFNLGISSGFKLNKLSSTTSFSMNKNEGYKLPGDTIRAKTRETSGNYSVSEKLNYNFTEKLKITANGSIFYNRVYDGGIIPADHAYAGIGGYVKANYSISKTGYLELTQTADQYSAYNVYTKNNDKHNRYSTDNQHCTRLVGGVNTVIGQIIAGAEYKPERMYSIRVNDSSQRAHELIAFVQDDYTINQHFSVVVGARGTQHSHYGFNFVPKISAMARFNQLSVRASYGKGFRSPTLKEMYYLFYHNVGGEPFWLKGNPNLKPEKSDYYGVSFELNHSKNNFLVNFYRNELRDMIANIWIEPKVGQYTNYESASVMGIDVLEKFMPNKNLLFSLGLSLVDAQNNMTHKKLNGSSPVSANFSTRYSFKILKKPASLEVFGKFTGKRTYEPIGEVAYADDAMNLWRCSFTQQFSNSIITSLGVDNIFNRVNPNSLGNTSRGIRYYISIVYKFARY